MTDKFQINGRHQLKSIKAGLPFFIWGPVSVLIGLFFLSERLGPNPLPFLLAGVGIYGLFIFSPAIYLHIIYFIDNEDTVLTVDKEKDEITIKTKNGESRYKNEDIKKSELNLVRRTDPLTRTMPWTTYGYMRLTFKDKKEFFFTSLMLDLDKLPLPAKTTRFRFIPYIDKNQVEYKDIKAHNDRLRQGKIAEYEERFKNLADDNLLEKINNPTKFEFEARKAAENIIEQRKKITTANKVFK